MAVTIVLKISVPQKPILNLKFLLRNKISQKNKGFILNVPINK